MENHLVIDIGPGLIQLFISLPALIAAIMAAIYAERSHRQVKVLNGSVTAAIERTAPQQTIEPTLSETKHTYP